MAKYGFLGMGIMGSAMAANLVRAGHDVTVWNRTAARCAPLVALGARQADTPREVAATCDVTFAMLSDPAAALAVLEGADGVLGGIGQGRGYVDFSTVDDATANTIASQIVANGARYLEAPVSGTKKPAEDGTLIILAAGAGVGAAASLMGAVIAYSVWQCDKLQYLRAHERDILAAPIGRRLLMLYHPTRWIQAAHDAADAPRVIRVCAANSIIVIVMFIGMTTMPRFSDAGMDTLAFWRSTWVALPLAAYALVVAGVCALVREGIRMVSRRLDIPMTARLLAGGALVALVVTVMPVLSTSVQHQIHTIGTLSATLGAGALFALAACKLLFAQWCIECRWTGGDIFPIMFAALLHGCAVAKLVPGWQPVVVVMTVAFCTAIVLIGNAPLAGVLMALFFPVKLLPLELAVTVMAWGAMQAANAIRTAAQSKATKRRITGARR